MEPEVRPMSDEKQGNGLAVSGFVVSLVGAVFGIAVPILLYFMPLAMGLIGVVLSGIGLARVKGGARSGKGLAIAGIVLGLIAFALGIAGAVALNNVVSGL